MMLTRCETAELHESTVGVILQELLQAARLSLGMEVSFVSEFEGQQHVFRYVDQAEHLDLLQVNTRRPLEETYCHKIVEGSLPELIRDASQLPEAYELAVTAEMGIRGHAGVPIRLADGSVFGTFCSFSRQAAHALNARDWTLMRVFSNIAGRILQEQIDCRQLEAATRTRIEKVLRRDGVAMQYQPIVAVPSGRVIGVEALARFPGDGGAGPEAWFSDAATVGMAETLDLATTEMGLEILDTLPVETFVATNVSVSALLGGRIVDALANLPLARVVLEITEHELIEDYDTLAAILAPLRRRGLRLAVDDAGAGYASFRHVLRLKPDLIKLDMSLTRDLDCDFSRRCLTASLTQFSREVGAQLIAEGVERPEELATLEQLGVWAGQGYLLHKPMDLEALRAILSNRDKESAP